MGHTCDCPLADVLDTTVSKHKWKLKKKLEIPDPSVKKISTAFNVKADASK